ncbi:MAG: TonB-dependent receptor [Proteobacteria bacterium]|nr:TonB-dependent receptor [Pseudomonadota bacterium]
MTFRMRGAWLAAACLLSLGEQPASAQTAPTQPQSTAPQPPPQSAQQSSPPPQSSPAPMPGVMLPEVVVKAAAPKPRAKRAASKAPQPKSAPASAQAGNQPPPAPQPPALNPPPGTTVVTAQSFAPVQAVSTNQITANGGATITDTLQQLPGVAGSTFAPGANRPIVRGLDGNRLRIQEGGLGTGDVSDISEDHGIPVDPCAVKSARVIHGPAALRFTNKAVGGVVDLETNTIPTAVPEKRFSGEVRGGLSSVDEGRDGCFTTTASAGGFVVTGSGFARHAGDYRIPGGVQANSFVDSSGYALGGAYVWASGYAGVSYQHFDSLYAIPGIESAASKSRIDMGQDKVQAKTEWRVHDFGFEAVRAWFGFVDYAHNELDFDAVAGHDIIGSRFTNREWEGRFEVDHAHVSTTLGALKGTAGIQLSNLDLAGISFDGDNLLEPNTTKKTAAFISEELRVSQPLKVLGSLRLESSQVSGATLSDLSTATSPLASFYKSFDTASGGLGIAYELSHGIVARLSGLYTERAPEAQELFSKGAHDATGTFEIGNPTLGIERARTIEGGFKRETGDFRFDTTAYYTAYQGYIWRELTGQTCDTTLASCSPGGGGGDLKQVIFGQKDATFYGTEMTAEYDVGHLWRGVWGIAGRFDFVRARFDDGENVPRIAPYRLGGGLYYRDAAWRARVDLLEAFKHTEVAPNETPTDGYTLLNAEASYTLKLAQDGGLATELTIGVKGENLLDEDMRNSASFKKDEVLLPGRNIRLFGVVKF